MTIDKAIELLKLQMDGIPVYSQSNLKAAMRLGIEALKRVKGVREEVAYSYTADLPGEE